jgi:hypothetical protein
MAEVSEDENDGKALPVYETRIHRIATTIHGVILDIWQCEHKCFVMFSYISPEGSSLRQYHPQKDFESRRLPSYHGSTSLMAPDRAVTQRKSSNGRPWGVDRDVG